MKKRKLKKIIKDLEERVSKLENPPAFFPSYQKIDSKGPIPCMHDDMKAGEVSGISCPCPKCTPHMTSTCVKNL